MIETPLMIVAAALTFVSAAWLHELTHAIAARALGGDVVEMDLVDLHVDFRFEGPAPRRRRLVLLAPALVGIATAPALMWLWSGEMTIAAAIAGVAWVIYTLNGGTQGELSIARAKPANR